MSRTVWALVYVLVMVAAIVTIDVVFLRDRFWARLAVNIAIVVVFAVFYLLVLRRV